jgi:hypothetical protein
MVLLLVNMCRAGDGESVSASNSPGKRYRKYDERMVKAYNSNPKRTMEVYVNAMRIVELAQLDNSSSSDSWNTKARKLITIACYYEANKALDHNDAEEVYVWSLRGIQNGDAKGELSGISLKELNKYLMELKNASWKIINNQKLKYGKLMRRVTDYQKITTEKQVKINSSPGRVQEVPLGGMPYKVILGPAKDSSGRLFVSVKLKNGQTLKVTFYEGQGWRRQAAYGSQQKIWYNTWEGCVAAFLKKQPMQ